jgi:hypothetical protein
VVLGCVLAACGCGEGEPDLVPLRGVVRLGGRPLEAAQVLFHPRFEGPGWVPLATTGPDGRFEATTRVPGDGVLPGPYAVSVVLRPLDADGVEGPNLLPESFADPETSGIRVEVDPVQGGDITIELTGQLRRVRP